MFKAIFTQLMNRKRSNAWIALELLLVFCVMWYLVDYFFVLTYNRSLPSYMQTDHTCQVNLATFPPEHPEYRAEEDSPEAIEANYARILNHLRSYPGIVETGLSTDGAAPGSNSFWGETYRSEADTTREANMRMIHIDPATDYFRVFAYTTDEGRTPVSVHDYEWAKPNGVVLSRQAALALFPEGNAVGQKIQNTYSQEEMKEVIGIVDDVKRFSVKRPEPACYVPRRIDHSNAASAAISVRIDPSLSGSAESDFLATFRQDMEGALRIGNFYYLSIDSYTRKLTDLNDIYGYTADMNTRLYLMVFFLVNLMLCVIGTFWYRIHVRREEIGLRMALGSSRKGIARLLSGEGLCLLLVILLPALLIEYQFVHAGLVQTFGKEDYPHIYLPDRTAVRFFLTNGLTVLLLSGVILLSVWLPARRASRMAPAEALHYE